MPHFGKRRYKNIESQIIGIKRNSKHSDETQTRYTRNRTNVEHNKCHLPIKTRTGDDTFYEGERPLQSTTNGFVSIYFPIDLLTSSTAVVMNLQALHILNFTPFPLLFLQSLLSQISLSLHAALVPEKIPCNSAIVQIPLNNAPGGHSIVLKIHNQLSLILPVVFFSFLIHFLP